VESPSADSCAWAIFVTQMRIVEDTTSKQLLAWRMTNMFNRPLIQFIVTTGNYFYW